MKISLERAALMKCLAHVQSVVERRNTIPILSNLLLQAEDGKLSVTATDLDIEVVETLPASVSQEGATTAPAHVLYDIVRKLPDGAEVSLHHDASAERLEISAGRSRFSLACLPKDDFPSMTAGDLPHRFTLPAATLKRLVDKTRFAISTEETRYYLNGIFLHCQGEGGSARLIGVATDGHRLAKYETAAPAGAESMPDIIFPRKAVGEIRKLIDDEDGEIQIAVSDLKIRCSFGGTILTSKLIDGTFPDYKRVIPSGNDKQMKVDGKVFMAAVDRVSTVSSEKSRAVKMTLDGTTLSLAVNSPDAGSASEELEVDYNADLLVIGFNARYLMEITGQVDGDTALFELQDAGSPTIARQDGDDDALYVLMPMRV